MANQEYDLPLYEKVWLKRRFQRVIDIFILLLLLLLLSYRLFSPNTFTFPWLLAFICESWFTFTWIVILNAKWSPALTITHPERLLQRVPELPRVDLFVTTADAILEPPIITVNTVLSLLALDYPSNKLACYVSDDGCSPLTFYALVEASKFAKLWIPFCKKYNIQVRAPFRYFSNVVTTTSEEDSPEFKQEWTQVKDMYDNLSQKIEDVTRKQQIPFKLDGEFAVFSNTEQRNHPSIIKVILENNDGLSDGLPHLIYISREKRPQYPHNYKAGAMNVLTRVSGLMTNAPFMLNVDCDMVVNNPMFVLHAMCILMDSKSGKEVAFVQCFQQFYDGIKDDPFGNQWVAAYEYIIRGMAGLQGPYYGGTNTFHRRNAIYGLYPNEIQNGRKGELGEKILIQQFGSSKELVKSAAHVLLGKVKFPNDVSPSSFIEAAIQVAGCGYEYSTFWGKKIGWLYGSISEDVPTGLNIQRRGWRSECCTPHPIPFTGCAPRGLLSTMVQQKRWASGLTVVFFGKHSPIMGMLFGKIQFRAGLSYFWLTNWGLRGPFLLCYVTLLAYCTITNTNIFPKGLGLWIPIALIVIYNVHTLLEYLKIGLSIRNWWNNQRMTMITTTTAWFIGFLNAMLKLSGLSDTVFDITEKEHPTCGADGNSADAGRFTFDESPVFVVGTTILLVHLTAMVIKLRELQRTDSGNGCGVGEFMCSSYVVVCYWPYLKGLFGRGKYGIPLSTIFKSAVFAFVFLHFCSSNVISS
ncbi:cellulose synthase-like protein H1 isoform X2 [Cajanus cajan]|uniref:cellulose synthase-like protein H1 isoform X2 n=1 Tax=Cajanus cajan TaxID=3821 RepID=UPI00098DBF6A|nr:cellulose synthase-like protein H1 isoform X2 [Cajanus cajan]